MTMRTTNKFSLEVRERALLKRSSVQHSPCEHVRWQRSVSSTGLELPCRLNPSAPAKIAMFNLDNVNRHSPNTDPGVTNVRSTA